MQADRQLHEPDPRARLIGAFPTDGAIEFLNRTVGRRTAATKDDDATRRAFGPTDLPEQFPWPRADGWEARGGAGRSA